ncbi:DUF885 domain-containing protein [Sphingomicrobium nitratireducens]|uniref:DUF885 domain-containing protein n=1 Tax=Sphingomicrobium nitratireducens TaxID=2964666 RepID=UPI00223FCE38|nr:DUF885 domain-containing protein [Sphingomicrobium nitratireducens]
MATLADDIVAEWIATEPFLPLFVDVGEGQQDRLRDYSPGEIARHDAAIDALLDRLATIDPAALTSVERRRDHAIANEMLEVAQGLRVCRTELWLVSQMDGWVPSAPTLADRQPVATAEERAAALRRWTSFPAFIATQIANLRYGLATGYSVPRSVAGRVATMVEGLIAEDPAASPFAAMARNGGDADFTRAVHAMVADDINPALRTYRDFLRDDYIPRARESLSLLDLPNGRACYDAMLRGYISIDRPGEEVAAIGRAFVADNVRSVLELGREAYGTTDLASTIARTKADPADRYPSREAAAEEARDLIERSRAASAVLVDRLPEQGLEVRVLTEAMEAGGANSNYEPSPDTARPAVYNLAVGPLAEASRSQHAITTLHEGYPGHHLQIGYTVALERSDLSKIYDNSAYTEGWARYAEQLGEEVGLLASPQARILRRIWPGRGMVVDPGIHLERWSRQQAIDYLKESGRFDDASIESMVDRIAIIPGQLTAYDTGGQEIKALRREAEEALGDRFDLAAFNALILRNGIVPLSLLRRDVEAWIAASR